MKVFNMSRPSGEARLEIHLSAAAELLMSICCLHGPEGISDYDLGLPRLTELRALVPPDLLGMLEEIGVGADMVPAHLLPVVFDAKEPRDVPTFLGALEQRSPRELYLLLLGCNMKEAPEAGPEVMEAAADGDAEARETLLRVAGEWDPWRVALERLFEITPERAKTILLEALPRWHEIVTAPLEAEFMGAAARDALAKQALAKTLSMEKFVEVATNGLAYTPTPEIRRLAFFPTYWLRPWLMTVDHRDTKIVCYPIADEFASTEVDAPPPNLVKLYKALGDEGRLRLLRRLVGGPLTLKEAADELGVAKSTAHHHLALLRQAGLVLMEEGDDKVYKLRAASLPEAERLLGSYLGGRNL